jgi:hypothetical protein
LGQKADVIFVGRVEGERVGGTPLEHQLHVRILKNIKGKISDPEIDLEGYSLAEDRFLVLSNPYEFREAHPLSFIGGCIRYMFPRGTTILFFVGRGKDGSLEPLGFPFARTAEDVPNADAPWVKLTELYVMTAAQPADLQKSILAAERDKLRATADDPVSLLMAADIDRQIAGPNRRWNEIMSDQMRMMGFGQDGGESKAKSRRPQNTTKP